MNMKVDGTDGSNPLQGRSPIKAVQDILDGMSIDSDTSDTGDGDEGENLDLKGAGNTDDKVDDQETDLKDESDESSEDETDGAQGTSEEVEIDSSTLAQLLGIDESDILIGKDGSPLFRAKVDGQDKEISFDSLLRNYRLQQHVDNNATQVKQEREAIAKEREQMRGAYVSAIQQAAAYITEQENELVKQFQSINWEQKRTENPTQYIIDRDGFRDRMQTLQAKRLELGQKWQQEQEKSQAEYRTNMEAKVAEEAQKIIEKIPEWSNKDIAKTESEKLKAYALNEGFTPEELNTLIDHRAWFMLRKAMLYDQSIGKAKETVKKVVKLPRVTKQKAPADQGSVKKVRLAKAKDAAMGGNRSAQVAFVNELIK